VGCSPWEHWARRVVLREVPLDEIDAPMEAQEAEAEVSRRAAAGGRRACASHAEGRAGLQGPCETDRRRGRARVAQEHGACARGDQPPREDVACPTSRH
jgi:hypothetical protein